jgi:hypothetical protein
MRPYTFYTPFFGSFSNLGIKGADDEELKQMASTPYRTHVYKVLNFDLIKDVQKELITNVCSGVDDQLNSLVSGEEGKNAVLRLKCWKWFWRG